MRPPAGIGAGYHGRGMGAALAKLRPALGLPDEEIQAEPDTMPPSLPNAGISSPLMFVHNENGSHNPKEVMNLDDFVAGIAVMRAGIEEAVK